MSMSMWESMDIDFIGLKHTDIGGDKVLGSFAWFFYDVRLVL